MATTAPKGDDRSEKRRRPFGKATTVYETEICGVDAGHSHVNRTVAQGVRVWSARHVWPKNVADVASQKTYGEKARTAGCDRGLKFYGMSACSQIRRIPYGGGTHHARMPYVCPRFCT
ncbi:hypothetical protein Bbelb_288700 [Branchiostoma belcheri]|nr:hypothetical protein Bbelb_288700 [Branchiostoma belcheri]